jgi:hypothetical protein
MKISRERERESESEREREREKGLSGLKIPLEIYLLTGQTL